MLSKYIVAGDWGTSTLRVYLICLSQSELPKVIDARQGPGVTMLEERTPDKFKHTLNGLIKDWANQYEIQRIILSGMIGSSIGWLEAPYSDCPIDFPEHAAQAMNTDVEGISCFIIGGLRTKNRLGLPDVMRGEETQLLGLLSLTNLSMQDDVAHTELVALPGTHNKWALLKDNQVSDFMTGFTGELFAALRQHTILLDQGVELEPDLSQPDFIEGVMVAKTSAVSLVHLLFSVRARQLVDGKNAVASLAYLLGLVIGSDIKGALDSFVEVIVDGIDTVTILGGQPHIESYSLALPCFGFSARTVNAEEATLLAYSNLNQYLDNV